MVAVALVCGPDGRDEKRAQKRDVARTLGLLVQTFPGSVFRSAGARPCTRLPAVTDTRLAHRRRIKIAQGDATGAAPLLPSSRHPRPAPAAARGAPRSRGAHGRCGACSRKMRASPRARLCNTFGSGRTDLRSAHLCLSSSFARCKVRESGRDVNGE